VMLLPKSGRGKVTVQGNQQKGHDHFIVERERGMICHETDNEAGLVQCSTNRCPGDGGTTRGVSRG
jgi:hypothetical protein